MENTFEQFDALWKVVNAQSRRVEELEARVAELEARLSPDAGECPLCFKPTKPGEDVHMICATFENHRDEMAAEFAEVAA